MQRVAVLIAKRECWRASILRPSTTVPLILSLARSASALFANVTKPKPCTANRTPGLQWRSQEFVYVLTSHCHFKTCVNVPHVNKTVTDFGVYIPICCSPSLQPGWTVHKHTIHSFNDLKIHIKQSYTAHKINLKKMSMDCKEGSIRNMSLTAGHKVNKNLAIANRSRVSCAHNMPRASTITPWPWNLS